LIAAASVSLITNSIYGANWDVGWYFETARRILEGEQLYRDFIEINLPFAVYVYVPFVFLSDIFGGPPSTWLAVGIACAIVPSMLQVEAAVGHAHSNQDWRIWVRFLSVAVILVSIPASDFGQRDHLAILLTLPYVTGVLLLNDAKGPSVEKSLESLALVAGVGFSLKPFFGIPWITTFFLAGRCGVARPVYLSVLAATPMAIQLLILPVFFPDLLEFYARFGAEYRQFWEIPSLQIILIFQYILLAALILLAIGGSLDSSPRRLALGMGCFSLSWFAAALVQGKGWNYHFIPALIAVCFGFWITYAVTPRLQLNARLVLLTGTVFLAGLGSLRSYSKPDYLRDPLQLPPQFVSQEKPLSAMPFSVRTLTAFPLVNELGVRHVGSISALWPLQVVYGSEGIPGSQVDFNALDSMGAFEREVFRRMVEDFAFRDPDLLLVSDGPDSAFNGACFDYMAYFSQDSTFRVLIEAYDRGPKVGHVRLYRKKDQ
jgi:hypothetical protein